MAWKCTLAILLLALGLRVLAGCWWQQRLPEEQRFFFGDSESYWGLAAQIAAGEPYALNPDRRAFRMPGYPLLLAPLFLLAGGEPPVLWARWQNAVFGVVAVALVMAVARQLFDVPTSLVAGSIAAVEPGAVAAGAFVLSEGPFCPLMLAQLLLWILAWRAPSPRRQLAFALAAGVAAGAATLVRPSWLLFLPFALTAAIATSAAAQLLSRSDLAHEGGFRNSPTARHLRAAGAMLCGLVLVMLPWWARNARVFGTFVPTTLQVGESLYDGLHPGATGASEMAFVEQFRRELAKAPLREPSAALGSDSFEERLDRRMRDAALAWATENPYQALRLAGVKFQRIWNVWPNEPSFRSPAARALVAAHYGPTIVLGLCGAAFFAARGWPYVLCALPAVYFTCLHMVFVGSLRYRQPPMLLMAVLAAGFLVWAWRGLAPSAPSLLRRCHEKTQGLQ